MISMFELVSLQHHNFTSIPEATILCLGNFDGVHIAHRELLRRAKTLRDTVNSNAMCGVLCFHDLSGDFLQTGSVAHLCTEEQKIERFEQEGIDFVLFFDFPSLRDLSPEQFIKEILIEKCHCVGAVCGFNYRFGKHAGGDADVLRKYWGAPVAVIPQIQIDNHPISATRIRGLIASADMESAAKLLTLPYGFTAPVLHGKKLGRKLGIPTINQYFPDKMIIPPYGVYVTDCIIDGKCYRGVTNVGVHPTVDENAVVNCETFLLDFSSEIYDQQVTISFLKFLRSEQKFDSVEELCKQIKLDVEQATAY